MKSILLNQLEERNRLLNQQYVERINDYDIQSLLHNPMIKLITGPRRVGKSVFALVGKFLISIISPLNIKFVTQRQR